MKFQDKTFTLKDGREALLRTTEETDAEAMLDYLRVTAGETDFLSRYPEECDERYSLEGEKAIINRINASENELMLACFVNGELAGVCNLMFNTFIKTRHAAKVAIAVVKKYWGQGIGTAMMRELIELAEKRDGVIQIELEFVEGNHRARAMYEKLGFRITGFHGNATMLKDGTLLNNYLMTKDLKKR